MAERLDSWPERQPSRRDQEAAAARTRREEAAAARMRRAEAVDARVRELKRQWEPEDHGKIALNVADEFHISTSTVSRDLATVRRLRRHQ